MNQEIYGVKRGRKKKEKKGKGKRKRFIYIHMIEKAEKGGEVWACWPMMSGDVTIQWRRSNWPSQKQNS